MKREDIIRTLNDREPDAREDAADVAAYDAAMAEIAAGRDGPLPAEVSALLLHGAGLVAGGVG
jgi:hypothetical protein